MNLDSLFAEKQELEQIISDIPTSDVIEYVSFNARLINVMQEIRNVTRDSLLKIRAECERLLELSSRRTQGSWTVKKNTENGWDVNSSGHRICVEVWHDGLSHKEQYETNGEYIAACSIAAEAGWRTTISTIDEILSFDDVMSSYDLTLINDILNAWNKVI